MDRTTELRCSRRLAIWNIKHPRVKDGEGSNPRESGDYDRLAGHAVELTPWTSWTKPGEFSTGFLHKVIRVKNTEATKMKIGKIYLFLAVACSLLFVSGCCNPEVSGNVPNTLHPQETSNWCWAATTQMLSQHLGIAVNQCDLANHRFGKTNCCNLQNANETCPKTDDCNTPGWLELDFAGVKFEETATARAWGEMRTQIYCAKKPMGYAYGTPGVVGHVLVIKGYITIGGTNYLILNDPWSPCSGEERIITYAEYADPAGTATHWNTWFNIAKK